jgi:hypothetical protein
MVDWGLFCQSSVGYFGNDHTAIFDAQEPVGSDFPNRYSINFPFAEDS